MDVPVVYYMDEVMLIIMVLYHSLPNRERVSSQLLLNLEKLNLKFAPQKDSERLLICFSRLFYF